MRTALFGRLEHVAFLLEADAFEIRAILTLIALDCPGWAIAERNILNVKPYPEEYSSLVERADILPGIRVDSKAWISISLDGYYEDDFIKPLIDMSYQKANGKRS